MHRRYSGSTNEKEAEMRIRHLNADVFLCIVAIILASLTIFCGNNGSDGSTENNPPVADAGGDYTGTVHIEIILDGTASFDPDGGDSINAYAWEVESVPDGSGITVLTNASTATPSFKPDVAGDYVVRLQVTDKEASMSPWDYSIITVSENQPPVADPGGPFTGTVNVEIILDGSASSDLEDQPLTYAWTFLSRPVNSAASLENASTETPSFTPDVIGEYIVHCTLPTVKAIYPHWLLLL